MKHKKKNLPLFLSFGIVSFCNGMVHKQVTEYATDTSKRYDIDYNVSGYVKFESYVDSRQVIGVATDQSLLFPEREDLDPRGIDKNGNGQTQIVALESRVRGDIIGPKVCGAHSHATIEGDFFSNSEEISLEADIRIDNLLRLRHAFLELDWEKVTLTFGQTWHPVFILDCYADTVSFNSGGPFDSFARMPQFRFTYHLPNVDLIASAASHVTGFFNNGPIGFSEDYLRNALMPTLHGQIRAHTEHHFFGTGYDVKRIRPRLKGNPVGIEGDVFATSESLVCHAFLAYYAYNEHPIKIATKFIYAQNGVDFGMIGGYAVHKTDPNTDRRQYTNISTANIWIDMAFTAYSCFEPGLFFGYTKNLGTGKTVETGITRNRFGLGVDIDQMFRIAPRCRWNYKNITFAAELEYTRAAFGTLTNQGSKAKIKNSSWVGNTRALFATFYFF